MSIKDRTLILGFLKTAAENNLNYLSAYLPSNHPVIREHRARQIRTLKGILAFGYDELDNRVVLTTQGKVLQLFAGENP